MSRKNDILFKGGFIINAITREVVQSKIHLTDNEIVEKYFHDELDLLHLETRLIIPIFLQAYSYVN